MRPRTLARFTRRISLATVVVTASLATAGDLTPPPGPVAPTMKPLDIVEPRIPIGPDTTPGDATSVYRITAPGAYYLTENLIGEPGKNGIQIDAIGEVWIDLNGMTARGVPGSLTGVIASGRVNVTDGFVTLWGDDGVSVGAATIERVTALTNGRDGIRALWGTQINRCAAEANGRDGISVADVSRIDNCVTKGNRRWGIHADGAITIAGCTVYNNTAGGIEIGLAHVTDCMIFSNTVAGVIDRGNSTIKNNTIHSSPVGIQVLGDTSRIESNHIVQCNTGIEIQGIDSIIIANSVRNSTTPYNIQPGNQAGAIVTSPVGAGPWDNFTQ